MIFKQNLKQNIFLGSI